MKDIPGQLTFEDIVKADCMYDGYVVKTTRFIKVLGNRIKICKGDMCYVVCKGKYMVNLAFPNECGGTFGLPVTLQQFRTNFEKVGKKVYPKSNRIWNGTEWIQTPSLRHF